MAYESQLESGNKIADGLIGWVTDRWALASRPDKFDTICDMFHGAGMAVHAIDFVLAFELWTLSDVAKIRADMMREERAHA